MELKDKIKNFPKTPGIYLMKDSNGDIIYVGKSKKLQDRVKSYFVNSKSHSRKVQRMVKGIYDIDIINTDTELDALLLECEMIKKIKPMYNKLMRNPENYVYLKIDKESEYPYLEVVKEIDDDKLYFGAYTIGKKIESVKETINEIYKIRSCKKMVKCPKYDLGKCTGPCRNKISREDYSDIIEKLIKDLSQNGENLFNGLEIEMKDEIEKLNFEKASSIKQNMDKLKLLFNKQDVINNSAKNENILAWIKLDENTYKVYVIKSGHLIKSDYMKESYFIELDKEKYFMESLSSYIDKNKRVIKDKVIDKNEIDYVNIIYSYIKFSDDIEYIIYNKSPKS